MMPVSELILRNRERLQGQRLLLVGAPADLASAALPAAGVQRWHWDAAQQVAEPEAALGVTPPSTDADTVIVFMPKAKPRLALLLGLLAAALKAGTRLWLAGEKREGIDSAGRWLNGIGSPPLKIDRARHCVLWECEANGAAPVQLLADSLTRQRVKLADQSLNLCSLPGVFSHGRVDEGTALLLQHLPALPSGRVLDFACGNGVISAFLLARQPAWRLQALDSDAFALEAARETLAANGQTAETVLSDGFAALRGSRYRCIVSNPPFHDGVRTDYGMTRGFIRDMAQHLLPDGEVWLVANRFLPYADALAEHFARVETPAQTSRFVVYHASRR